MHQTIGRTLSSFELGEAQSHANMVVLPILRKDGDGPDYLTLKEALDAGLLIISEVSEGGSVPNLKVHNKAEKPVLLLDGEELAGAKQNRVLNTTILVKAQTEVVIPVSCTEHGRWSYAGREFSESGNVMARNIRASKAQGVSHSYALHHEARSDQGRVWDEIHAMAMSADVPSQTGAMRDVFEGRKEELDDYLKAFSLVPGQKGLLVLIGGQAVGFDELSLERAFAGLYPKLVKSYAMEAWLEERKNKGARANGKAVETALAFLKEAEGCEEKVYASVGLGEDFRYSGPRLVGSALLVEGTVIHAAFFRVTEEERAGNMVDLFHRRSFRV